MEKPVPSPLDPGIYPLGPAHQDITASGRMALDKFQGFPGNQFFVMVEGGHVVRILQP